jgi:GNAT superfamily N-acetyltransferase
MYDDPSIGGPAPGKGFETYLDNPERRGGWVAELDGQVVGLAGLLVHGDEGQVEPGVVSANHRSHGIGRALVGHVIGQANLLEFGT